MERLAMEVGRLLAMAGMIVVTGGKDGIMEAAAKGASEMGGITVGVIKGSKRHMSNPYTDIEVMTGMQADGLDELLLTLMSDAIIVIGGGAGTLQEVAIAYRNNKPIITLAKTGGWGQRLANQFLDNRKRVKIRLAKTPADAVHQAIRLCKAARLASQPTS